MKHAKLIIIFLFIFFIIVLPFSYATVGIGIRWYTEKEKVSENSEFCVNYGLYNPFDEDVMGYLTAGKELSSFYVSEDAKNIPSKTSSKNNIMTKICFTIPKIYKEDCLVGNFFLCKRECKEEQKIYEGEVMASYNLKNREGLGSATGTSFASPLKLIVMCEPKERNWTPVVIIIILMLIAIWFRFKKKPKKEKDIYAEVKKKHFKKKQMIM